MAQRPSFVQLDPVALRDESIDFTKQGFDLADADANSRLGNLYPTRDAMVQNAADNVAGIQDPSLNSAFESAGLGDVNLGSNAYQVSKNLRQPILSGNQRNRNYFQSLWTSNPKRSFFDPNLPTITAASNSGDSEAFNAALGEIDSRNSAIANQEQSAQLGAIFKGLQPLTTAGTGALTDTIRNSFTSPSLDPGYYNYNTSAPTNYGSIDPNTYVAPAGSDVAGAFTTPADPNSSGGW